MTEKKNFSEFEEFLMDDSVDTYVFHQLKGSQGLRFIKVVIGNGVSDLIVDLLVLEEDDFIEKAGNPNSTSSSYSGNIVHIGLFSKCTKKLYLNDAFPLTCYHIDASSFSPNLFAGTKYDLKRKISEEIISCIMKCVDENREEILDAGNSRAEYEKKNGFVHLEEYYRTAEEIFIKQSDSDLYTAEKMIREDISKRINISLIHYLQNDEYVAQTAKQYYHLNFERLASLICREEEIWNCVKKIEENPSDKQLLKRKLIESVKEYSGKNVQIWHGNSKKPYSADQISYCLTYQCESLQKELLSCDKITFGRKTLYAKELERE